MSHWVLVLLIFPTDHGHGASWDSYRDRIQVSVYPTQAECLVHGEQALRGFWSAVDPSTHSRDLMGYQCVEVKD